LPEPIETQKKTPAPGEHVTVGPMGRPTRIHLKKGNEDRGYVNTIRRSAPVIVVLVVIALLVFLVLR
jgi:hypothetical protein